MTQPFGVNWSDYAGLANFLSGAGGVLGALAAVIGLPAVLFTWHITRKSAYRSKVYSVITEMLTAQREIVASLKVGDLEGREVFSAMLREFDSIYKLVARGSEASGQNWSTVARVDISYTFLLFGPTYTCWDELKKYDDSAIKDISQNISKLKNKFVAKKLFIGHQNRLSHYLRNLYSSFEFIGKTKLGKEEKSILGKLFRTQLTNYEQALLAYNCLSHYGSPWISNGLLEEFQVIKNIPRLFFELDGKTTFKELFPHIKFEWESQ